MEWDDKYKHKLKMLQDKLIMYAVIPCFGFYCI